MKSHCMNRHSNPLPGAEDMAQHQRAKKTNAVAELTRYAEPGENGRTSPDKRKTAFAKRP
jgi:hypothetical protein